jgi:signal transduction histidine kinase
VLAEQPIDVMPPCTDRDDQRGASVSGLRGTPASSAKAMEGAQSSVNEPSSAELDRGALVTLLTTEHFTLQGSRASTISESSSRAALYVGALSSSLIALGFLGQAAEFDTAFDVFALVVLPTIYLLGLFTHVRVVQSSIEDIFYGRAINRIRGVYRQLAGSEARYFMLGGHDDVHGVLANMGLGKPSRWQLYLTLGTMVEVVNSVVGGTTVALAVGVLGASLAGSVLTGAVALVASLAFHGLIQRRTHDSAREAAEPMFPSDGSPLRATAADRERRRLERDLHDGVQQQLVSLSLRLRLLAGRLAPGSEAERLLADARNELAASLQELRDLTRGIHPAILGDHGLHAALEALTARALLPVELLVELEARAPDPVEVAAYYLVSEGLTNIVKHSDATSAAVSVAQRGEDAEDLDHLISPEERLRVAMARQ